MADNSFARRYGGALDALRTALRTAPGVEWIRVPPTLTGPIERLDLRSPDGAVRDATTVAITWAPYDDYAAQVAPRTPATDEAWDALAAVLREAASPRP